MTRGVRAFRSSRTACSSMAMSTVALALLTPIMSVKARMASGV